MLRCTICGDAKGAKRREETCPDCETWAHRVGMRLWVKLAHSRRAKLDALRAAAMVDKVWREGVA